MLQILGRSSSINVRKVLWTCEVLGIQYEQQAWGAGFRSTAEAEFEALNPNKLVPVIKDDDFILWESDAIIRYLCARQGDTTLMPSTPHASARVNQWLGWCATELNTAWRYAFLALVRASPAHRDPEAIAASVASWNAHMAILDRQLQRTGGFVCGDAFTLADIVLGLATHRWIMTPMQRPSLPAVQAYYERLRTRPAFQAWARDDMP